MTEIRAIATELRLIADEYEQNTESDLALAHELEDIVKFLREDNLDTNPGVV